MTAPVDVVREFCALMEKRDAEALRPLLADSAVYQNVGMPAVTRGRRHRGELGSAVLHVPRRLRIRDREYR